MTVNDKERFLLHYLRNRQINWGIDVPIKEKFTDYKDTIEKLKCEGYLIDDDYFYFLETKNISELKDILSLLSLSTNGKKEELVNRIKLNTTAPQRKEICSDLYYVLTKKGIEEEETYFKAHKKSGLDLKKDILQLVKQGLFKDAVFLMCDVYSGEFIPPGIATDWSNKEQIWNSQIESLTQIQELKWSDLNNSKSFIELLIKCMFYDHLIEHNLQLSINYFIDDAIEKMNCDSLNSCFQRYGFNASESQIWYTYLSTKRFNLYQSNLRNSLKNNTYTPLPEGEYCIDDSTIRLWKEYQEYSLLSIKNIEGFPKTYQTYQKHKMKNSDKYKDWISRL